MKPFHNQKGSGTQEKVPISEMRITMYLLVGLVGAFLFLITLVEESEGKIITVDDNGNAEYTKIQDAVDAAGNGDTIFVYNGEYNESVHIDDRFLIIEGESREEVIIRGEEHDDIITGDFENNPGSGKSVIRVSNLTVLSTEGDGITLCFFNESRPGYNVVIDNCTIIGEYSHEKSKGTGVSLQVSFPMQYGTISIENSIISGFGEGIGFWIQYEAGIPVSIRDCEIRDNDECAMKFLGGGMLESFSMVHSRIFNNSYENDASIHGRLEIGDFCIDSCEIFENRGTGIDLRDIRNFTLKNSKILLNNGDGVRLDRRFKDINICNNEIMDNSRNGIHLNFWTVEYLTIEIVSNNISGNENGLFYEGSSENTTELHFKNNELFYNMMGAHFDFLDNEQKLSGNSTIKNNVFVKNHEALLISHLHDFSVEDCEFVNNDYGLLLEYDENIAVSYCLFEDNGNGLNASIYKSYLDNIEISNNDFRNNTNGIYLYYVIDNELPEIEIIYNDFLGNANGIFIHNEGSNEGGYLLDVHQNNFAGNTNFGINYTGDNRNTVNAKENWWNATSGPYHPTSNPDGEGDELTNNVHFDPWLTKMVEPWDSGSLSGAVRDPYGNPLENVRVLIDCGGGELHQEEFTNETGHYVITHIPLVDCCWTITASKEGYEDSKVERPIDEGSVQDFILYPIQLLYVDDDAPPGGDGSQERPFNRIQDAIDNASEGSGIRVWAGTYFENVAVDRPLSIIGNGSVNTTIDGCGNGDVVTITADGVYLIGFTMRNSGQLINGAGIKIDSNHTHIAENNCTECEYGILLSSADSNTLVNNTCTSNWDTGLNLWYSHHNTISSNIFSYNYDGIYLDWVNEHNTLTNNSIISNRNYGIRIDTSRDNVFMDNTISMNAIGIHLESASQDNRIHFNTILDNRELGIDALENHGYTINATHNWWGEKSGPYHPAKNPSGKGDNVTDFVEFDPWTGKEEVPPKLSDLEVISITVTPESPREGTIADLTAVITNSGSTGSENVKVSFYKNALYGDDHVLLGSMVIESISAGERKTVHMEWDTTGQPGDNMLLVMVDPDDEIEEIDELNNEGSLPVNVEEHSKDQYGVDITASSFTLDLAGKNFTFITLTVRNTGEVRDSYTFSITGDYRGWTVTLESPQKITLDPGEENTISLILLEDSTNASDDEKITVVISVKSVTHEEVQDSVAIEGILDFGDNDLVPFLPPAWTAAAVGTAGVVAFFRRRKYL